MNPRSPAPPPAASLSEPDAQAPRAAARRAQILAAARECFREHGFHAASIAQISRTAGMSPGHIYHYFASKEAIIEAIIAADLERSLQLAEQMRSATRIVETSVELATQGAYDKLDPAWAALELEIVAEAARNENVARMLRTADATQRASFGTTLRAVRQALGHNDSDEDIATLSELISALFEGLPLRSVANPDIDRQATARLVALFITEFVHTVRLSPPDTP